MHSSPADTANLNGRLSPAAPFRDEGDAGRVRTDLERGTVLRLLVRNHPGVMSHVCGLFARRAFNEFWSFFAAWGQMLRPQSTVYGEDRIVATRLNRTRYDLIVEAMGGHGEHVTEPDQIRPALERALASGKPALVNVEMRTDVGQMKGSTYV